MSGVIPDPEQPQRWAVDARTGGLLTGAQFVSGLLNMAAPTLRELEEGTTIWLKDGSVTFGPIAPADDRTPGPFQIPCDGESDETHS